MSRYIDAEPWENMDASVKYQYHNKCGDTLTGYIMMRDIHTEDVAPVVHAKWITRNDKGIISMTHPYMCSRCWRVEMNKEPYCNCGAKMDGGDNDADD